ncbi:MAG: FimV/HubP family polar landmark protein [Rhodoferax sp.]
MTVQSAFGEPLRAEIDVPEITAEEAATFRVVVPPPAAFSAAGLEYNAILAGMQVTLQRRADGRAAIRLSSERPVNEPFVDLVMEVSWNAGRIMRSYTMLFDPPGARPVNVNPTLAQTPAVQSAPASVPGPVARPVEPARMEAPASKPVTPASPPATAATRPAAKLPAEASSQISIKAGDTASKIAMAAKVPGVSLDQLLVAMLRASPQAFIDNNVNRIRAGALVDVPTAAQANSVAPAEATRIIAAQSKDFNAFRRNLANSAPVAAVASAERKASGVVQAKVEEKKPAAATPDKLTLSKGAVVSKANEAQIAKQRADQEAAARAAEIAKNISDLKKASSAIAQASAPTASAAAAAQPTVAAPPVLPAAPASAAPASSAKPAASAAAKPAAPPAPAPAAPELLDELLEDPLLAVSGAALAALLVGGGVLVMRQRKKKAPQVDSSFLESRLQPDSFFGASGGQRVDTNNPETGAGTSMVYSSSQLDAADDVDPVAEADVYMAYGRDLQAEEILKEALNSNPGRLAIYTKLLEIFAKRRDASNFEATARQAHKLTGSTSPEWIRVCELGIGIDPENPLYQPGGAPAPAGAASAASDPDSDFGKTVAQSTQPNLVQPVAPVDVDLDLDFSLDEEPVAAISDVTGSTVNVPDSEQTLKLDAPGQEASNGLDFDVSGPAELDFDVSGPAELSAAPEAHAPLPSLPEIPQTMDGLSLEPQQPEALPDFEPTGPAPVEPVATPAPAASDSGLLEFDIGSLSLDLDTPPAQEPTPAPDSGDEDPLETKLALAEEFVSIGDEDGARALIEEVIAEATGDMRAKAERALAQLS